MTLDGGKSRERSLTLTGSRSAVSDRLQVFNSEHIKIL